MRFYSAISNPLIMDISALYVGLTRYKLKLSNIYACLMTERRARQRIFTYPTF